MGSNLAIVLIVVVLSIVIGAYLGGKLRRKR